MKILQVHNFYQNAGGEFEVFNAEAELLREKGHTVVQYTLHNNEIDRMSGIQAALKTLWNPESYLNIKKIILCENPDICHFHNTFPLISPSAYHACQKYKVPVVQTLHNYRLLCPAASFFRNNHVCELCLGKPIPWPAIKYQCYRNSKSATSVVVAMLSFHRLIQTWQTKIDQFIALTNFSKEKFIEGGFSESKMVVNPNFMRADPGIGGHTGEFALFVGRICSEKGIEVALDAWSRLPDFPLKIIGDGPAFEKVSTDAKKYVNIEVLGRQPHNTVIDLMKSAKFLLFPSLWYEGFPMTIIEAYACGLPVVASRMGSMQEIVNHKTGFLFDPEDPGHLTRLVLENWHKADLWTSLSQNARAAFEKSYSKHQKYQSLMNIYQRVICEKNSQHG